MNVLLFFLYFVSFFPGFVCAVLGVAGYVKSRDPLIKLHILFFVPISVALFISLVTYFLTFVLPVDFSERAVFVFVQLRALIRSPAFYFIPLYFHGFIGRPMGRAARAVFVSLIPVGSASPLVVWVVSGSASAVSRFYATAFPFFFYASVLYSAAVVIVHRRGVDTPDKRLLLRGFLIICVSMVPVLILQYVNYEIGIIRVRYAFFFEYLFYSSWSAFYSTYLIRTVFLPRPAGAGARGMKYLKSRISDAEADRYRAVIEASMERDALYRDCDLTLDRLSAASGISRNHISQVLNQYIRRTFYDFVNAYRVREARRLLSDPDCRLSVLEIAFEAGFNSKTTFYAAYKKMEGVSPTEFRTGALAGRPAPASDRHARRKVSSSL